MLGFAKSTGNYKFVCNALSYARNKGFMRLQPVYGLARLMAEQGKGVPEASKEVFNSVIRTPKDLADLMAISKSLHEDKTEGGRRIKTLAGNWLLGLTEYWAIKYGAEKSDGDYSLSDMIRITHPNAQGKKLPIFDYLLGKDASLDELTQIKLFEALKVTKDASEKAAIIKAGRLPHEVASSFAGKDKDVWRAIALSMPTFALLRHLRTLEELGLTDEIEVRRYIANKLTALDSIRKAKIFPFRLMSAFNKVTTTFVQDVLRIAIENSIENVPALPGSTAIIIDRSGSMSSDHGKLGIPFMTVAAMFGLSLAKRASGTARVMLFDDRVEEFSFSRVDSLLTQAKGIQHRGATFTSLPFEKLLTERYSTDTIVLITDEQQNVGVPLVDVMAQYRQRVSPNVKLFIVDVAPYNEKLTPPDMPNTWYLYGWSDNILNFISQASSGFKSLVDYLENQYDEAAVSETQGEGAGPT
jgi:60 kDa SS-A/Ro ribonucleoprotein